MRKVLFFAIVLILSATSIFSQESSNNLTYEQVIMGGLLPSLSQKDMELLKRLPELPVPGVYKTQAAPILPAVVDNSSQPFMRPVFSQVALECGQASGVAYNFTYEMNYRRNLPANIVQNQYPTHYVWNFSNNGASCGVSFLESWEIIRGAGTVNIADYGGMHPYGENTWLSGYNYYYQAMKNRIDEIYSISVSTPEGIQNLKHWIHDHLEGASVGGVATFGGYATSATTLPPGTPEAGKCVTVNWTPYTNHQLVIVGYNDSIRYDFNGDGMYTNNIDINNDGTVDVKDWEIGGVKWVNSFGTGVGNGGYCYTMYKNLADPKPQGGIWNNTVYVVIPKPNYEPRCTFKVIITDNNRSKLKLMAGVSADTTATAPDHIMEFPVFNYQGGDYYMQGGTSNDASKTLELGLDVTPLLSFISSGQPAKFFLLVNEKDPDHIATGEVNSFSMIDYTPLPVQSDCMLSNITIADNALTVLSVTKTISFPIVTITDAVLPEASVYQPYSHQLSANGGTPPYDWEMVMDYSENMFTVPFQASGTEQLQVNNNNDGMVSKTLPFTFPYYGKNYDRVVVHLDGYLMFDDQALPWPFIIDETIYQHNTLNIAPFMNKAQELVPGEGDGIWYAGNQDSAVIRWKTSINSYTSSTDVNYSVVLFPDGRIDFHYGSLQIPYWLPWVSGISAGDLFNYHVTYLSGSNTVSSGTRVTLSPAGFPTGLVLSKTGLLSGTLDNTFIQKPLKVMVRDSRDIRDTKTFYLDSRGIEIYPEVHSGGDSLIQYAETCYLTLHIKNSSATTFQNPVFYLRVSDPFLTLTDSLETSATLNPDDTLSLNNCFSFSVANGIPDKHPFIADIYTVYNGDTLGRSYPLFAYSPCLSVNSIQVIDAGNGNLDPGETSNILVTLLNSGGAPATGLNGVFTCNDPYLTINSYISNIPNLLADGSGVMVLNVTAALNTPLNHLVAVKLQVSGNNQLSFQDTLYLIIGFCGETFESQSFDLLEWTMSGDAPWFISDSLPFEGLYCAQSGDIGDNDESILSVNLDIQSPGNVSFYQRVSCEQDVNNHNYDYLSYSVDDVEKARWDGETTWTYSVFPITTGNHTLTWKYHKDYSVSTGRDAAWVDMISFPPFGNIIALPENDSRDYGLGCLTAPNPFSDEVSFVFPAVKTGNIRLQVFTIQGEKISDFTVNPSGDGSRQTIHWNGQQTAAYPLKPGMYLYTLSTYESVYTGKLIKH